MEDKMMSEEVPQSTSRRNFIKGVVAAGAVASSSAYLFRGSTVHGQPAAGAVELITCILAVAQLSAGILLEYKLLLTAIGAAMVVEIVLSWLWYGRFPHLASAYITGQTLLVDGGISTGATRALPRKA